MREKEIISTNNETDETSGAGEFVVMDRISVGEEKLVVVGMEAKRSSLGEATKQCLLAMKDARVTVSLQRDTWRMLKYDGKFRMTNKIDVLFDTMGEG